MLRLVLENITDKTVTYRYYPEHGDNYGLFTVDRISGHMISKDPRSVNDRRGSYFVQAISAVRNMVRSKEPFPEHRLVAWY